MVNRMEISFSAVYEGAKKVKFSPRGERFAIVFRFLDELEAPEYKTMKAVADIIVAREVAVDFAFNKEQIEFYFVYEVELGLEIGEVCTANLILDEIDRVYLILESHDVVLFAARLDNLGRE